MKQKRYSKEKIQSILKEHQAGSRVADLSRCHGVAESTIRRWTSKHRRMDVSNARRLRELGQENVRLKAEVSDLRNQLALKQASLNWCFRALFEHTPRELVEFDEVRQADLFPVFGIGEPTFEDGVFEEDDDPWLQERVSLPMALEISEQPDSPSLETRLAILKANAEAEGHELDDSVALFLVANLRWKERLIDGALQQVLVYTRLRGLPITVEYAREALWDVLEVARVRRIPTLLRGEE
ncbi:MAG: transposase [Rhodospirillaceae bacterium]|nr:transposase [Rhodospirillaceae bacterium]